MNKRYAFCNFSNISGYPHPVPSKDEWENSLPRFRGEEWEVLVEHLLDFHDFIHRLEIVHEDVQIKLFRYPLEGISLDWCRSLPNASVSFLTGFHSTFNSFCKEYFPVEYLFEGCCKEFYLLHKDFVSHKNQICDVTSIIEEDIYHEDQEVLNDSNNIETSSIISDVSVVLDIDEDQHISLEYSDVKEQEHGYTSTEESYRSELQSYELLSLATHGNDHLSVGQMSIEISKAIPQFSDLQIKGDDHKCVHAVVDTSYEFVDQNCSEDQNSNDISCKNIIV